MSPSRVLSFLAVLLWAASLVSLVPRRGERWYLDQTAPSSEEWEARSVAERARSFRIGDPLRPAAGPGDAGGAVDPEARGQPLGASLRALRERMQTGDDLVLRSDGRASDRLPASMSFAGIAVSWRRLEPGPRIVRIDAPAAWPAEGDLLVHVELDDVDWERGSLRVEADGAPGLQATVRRLGLGHAELRLALAEPSAGLEQGLGLRFVWSEDGRRSIRERFLAPPGRVLVWAPPTARYSGLDDHEAIERVASAERAQLLAGGPGTWSAAERAAHLDAGRVLLLGSGRLAAWAEHFRGDRAGLATPFVAAPEPELGLEVLLDLSGSMGEPQPDGGTALEEARAALLAWAGAWPRSHRFAVRPFAAELGAALDPREPADREALLGLRAFGPTDLLRATAAWTAQLPSRARLVLLSDGRVPGGQRPELRAWAEELRASDRALHVVPVGAGAARDLLAELGTLHEGERLMPRLLDALAGGEGPPSGAARPVEGALWPLPDPAPELGARDRMRLREALPGNPPAFEPLLADTEGQPVAGLRRGPGEGLLLVQASAVDAAWCAAWLPLVEERRQPRLRRAGKDLRLHGDWRGWSAWPLGRPGQRRLFDPQAAGLWLAEPFEPEDPVVVRGPSGRRLRLPAVPPGQRLLDPARFARWVEAVAALAPPPRPHRGLLLGGILCALAALGVAWHRRRGKAE